MLRSIHRIGRVSDETVLERIAATQTKTVDKQREQSMKPLFGLTEMTDA